jgi:hypothetical protein
VWLQTPRQIQNPKYGRVGRSALFLRTSCELERSYFIGQWFNG